MNFRNPIQRALILAAIACVSGCAANLHKMEFGVIGGNAYMDVSVEFVEMPGQKVVKIRHYNASTRFIEGIFSAATPKQVQAVAADIVLAVKGSTQ